ncbi:hypothetical protein BU15DRAFT_66597 [Melanogaster broomeanus]|nr:hypothetical protein BU15DRAFT_66597 [Melanogaster broomeanus]
MYLLPQCTKALCQKLFDSYTRSQSKLELLPDEELEVITPQMTVILDIADGAYTRQNTSHRHSANEAERRHDFDTLLTRFFKTDLLRSNEQISNVLLERMIHAPRNPTVDRALDHDDLALDTNDHLCALFLGDIGFNRSLSDASRDAAFTAYSAQIGANPGDAVGPVARQLREVVVQLEAARKQSIIRDNNLGARYMKGEDFVATVTAHSGKEPKQGKCDTILVAPVDGIYSDLGSAISGQHAHNQFLAQFRLVQDSPTESDEVPLRLSQTKLAELYAEAISPVRAKSTAEATQLTSDDRYLLKTPRANVGIGTVASQDLLLPILLAEYKKHGQSTLSKAMNQSLLYLVSSLRFLTAIDMADQPVFGLVTSGTCGALTMAWKHKEKIFILERNVKTYDIADPMHAFQLALVIVRLAKLGQRLKDEFATNKKKGLLKKVTKLNSHPELWWSKAAQIDELDKVHRE